MPLKAAHLCLDCGQESERKRDSGKIMVRSQKLQDFIHIRFYVIPVHDYHFRQKTVEDPTLYLCCRSFKDQAFFILHFNISTYQMNYKTVPLLQYIYERLEREVVVFITPA